MNRKNSWMCVGKRTAHAGKGHIKGMMILALALLFAIPVGAEDMSADGLGATYEEAKQDSLDSFAKRYLGVQVNSFTETRHYEDSDGKVQDSFSDSTSSFNAGDLLGVTFELVEQGDLFRVRASITEDNMGLYERNLKKISAEIDWIYPDRNSGSIREQENAYLDLISLINRYENYSTIYLELGGKEEDIPSLKCGEDSHSIMDRFYEFVNVNEDKLSYRLRTGADDGADIEAEIARLRELREKAEAEMKESERFSWEQQKDRIQSTIDSYIAASGTMEKVEDTEDPSVWISKISELLDGIAIFKRGYSSVIASETEALNLNTEEAVRELENRPYRSAETAADGSILPQAVQYRMDEMEALRNRNSEKASEVLSVYHERLGTELLRKRDELVDVHEELELKTFRIDSRVDEVVLDDISWDPGAYMWKMKVRVPKLGDDFTVTMSIPFSLLSSVDIPDGDSHLDPKYKLFLDQVEVLSGVLKSGAMKFVLDYNVKCPLYSEYWRIDPVKLLIGIESTKMSELDPGLCSFTGLRRHYHGSIAEILDFREFPAGRAVPEMDMEEDLLSFLPTGVPSLLTGSSLEVMAADYFHEGNGEDDPGQKISEYFKYGNVAEMKEKRASFLGFGWSADLTGSYFASPWNGSMVGKMGLDCSLGLRVGRYFLGLNTGAAYTFDPMFMRISMSFEFGYGFLTFRDLYTYTRMSFNSSNNGFNMDLGIKYRVLDIMTFGVSFNTADTFSTLGATLTVGVSGI